MRDMDGLRGQRRIKGPFDRRCHHNAGSGPRIVCISREGSSDARKHVWVVFYPCWPRSSDSCLRGFGIHRQICKTIIFNQLREKMEPDTNRIEPGLKTALQANANAFGGELKQAIQDLLNSRSFRETVIEMVNENVNIPILSESTEAKLFGQAYDWVALAMVVAIDKID